MDKVADEASAITKRVNDRIAAEAASWSPYEYRSRVDQIAEEEIPPGWEWTTAEGIGAVPSIIILRHDHRV